MDSHIQVSKNDSVLYMIEVYEAFFIHFAKCTSSTPFVNLPHSNPDLPKDLNVFMLQSEFSFCKEIFT